MHTSKSKTSMQKFTKGISTTNKLDKATMKQCCKGAHELNTEIALNSSADGTL